MKRITTGLAVLGLAAASLALAGPAAAQSQGFSDARGDMPQGHGADLHRVRVVNEDFVRVRVTHDDLRRSYQSGSSLAIYLDTDRARTGPEYVFLGGTFQGTDYVLLKARGFKPASQQTEPLRCGYRMALDYADDTATVTMDRDCLGEPRGVRVAVKTGGQVGDDVVRDWLNGRRDFTRWVPRG